MASKAERRWALWLGAAIMLVTTLPYLVGRFEKGDEVEIPQRRRMQRKPTDYLRHIYYDSITYDPRSLQYLVSIVGASQVMLGTDWPHQVGEHREWQRQRPDFLLVRPDLPRATA